LEDTWFQSQPVDARWCAPSPMSDLLVWYVASVGEYHVLFAGHQGLYFLKVMDKLIGFLNCLFQLERKSATTGRALVASYTIAVLETQETSFVVA
jgi:hypothetical protein